MAITFDGRNDRITTTSQGLTVPQNVSGTFQAGGLAIGAGSTILVTDSEGRVAIGTATFPSMGFKSSLVVNGGIESLRDSGGEGGQVVLRAQSGGIYRWCIDNNSTSSVFRIFREDDASAANGLEMFKIDSSGRVTAPYQPAFMVRGDETGSKAADSKFLFTKTPSGGAADGKVCFDRANNWSNADDRFTAPVTGVYHFMFGLYRQSATSSPFSMAPRINGAQVSTGDTFIFFTSATGESGNTDDGMYGSFYMNLSANDYVELYVRTGGPTITIYNGHSFFGGHLVG